MIIEITISGQQTNIIHKNLHLIQTTSLEEAYAKAITSGEESQTTLTNQNNQIVHFKFRGIAELETTVELDIYDGCELRFEEIQNISEENIQNMISTKEQLDIFSGDTSHPSNKNNLDYGSQDIRKRALNNMLDSTASDSEEA